MYFKLNGNDKKIKESNFNEKLLNRIRPLDSLADNHKPLYLKTRITESNKTKSEL